MKHTLKFASAMIIVMASFACACSAGDDASETTDEAIDTQQLSVCPTYLSCPYFNGSAYFTYAQQGGSGSVRCWYSNGTSKLLTSGCTTCCPSGYQPPGQCGYYFYYQTSWTCT